MFRGGGLQILKISSRGGYQRVLFCRDWLLFRGGCPYLGVASATYLFLDPPTSEVGPIDSLPFVRTQPTAAGIIGELFFCFHHPGFSTGK